jgi:hypothetical protein
MRFCALVLLLASACAPTRVIVVAPVPPPQRIEYRCAPWPIPPGGKLDPTIANKFLNEMGAQGWDSYIGNEQIVCFKRYIALAPTK